jgi:hypothetical protein
MAMQKLKLAHRFSKLTLCEYGLSRSSPLILNLIFFLKIELPSAEGLLLKTMLNMWRDFNSYIGMKFKMILIEDN